MANDRGFGFWVWLSRGSGGAPGYRRLVNRWALVHLVIGGLVAYLSTKSLENAAIALLLPLAGILIGLSFAWGGNAQALLQTKEVEGFVRFHAGGFAEYLYVFQLAILVILTTLVTWGLAGLGVFDSRWPTQASEIPYLVVEAVLYALASLTLRSCWHVVLAAQYLMDVRMQIREQNRTGG